MARAEIGHARQHQRPAGIAGGNHHMLVQQHRQPQAPQLVDPGRGARIVFMVAGHEKRAVARTQVGQRRHLRGQLVHPAIDQVAGDRHHIGLQRVDTVHNAAHIALPDGRPDMHIADLRHGEALPRRRQAGNRHIDPHHRRRAPGVQESQQR